jgi:RNA recognition motif-containing protein
MATESGPSGVKTIYLGNLPVTASPEDVRTLCGQHGEVADVLLMFDPDTGHSRGFGFVKMESGAAAKAIEALDGADYGGRTLRANEARNRGAKPPRRSF